VRKFLIAALILLTNQAIAQDITVSNLAPALPQSTTAALPTCNAAATGKMYLVTDALTPVALASVAGGGAVKVLVFCNGSSWIVG